MGTFCRPYRHVLKINVDLDRLEERRIVLGLFATICLKVVFSFKAFVEMKIFRANGEMKRDHSDGRHRNWLLRQGDEMWGLDNRFKRGGKMIQITREIKDVETNVKAERRRKRRRRRRRRKVPQIKGERCGG